MVFVLNLISMRFPAVKTVSSLHLPRINRSEDRSGYNHSGKLGQVDFLNGVMGVANAQRTLNYIRIFTEFISQVRPLINILIVA